MSPDWLEPFATASMALAFLCAAIVLAWLLLRPQKMWIMNVVWPVLFPGESTATWNRADRNGHRFLHELCRQSVTPFASGSRSRCRPLVEARPWLPDEGLWVWSPVALTEELTREVDALGTVKHIVSPNRLHHRFPAGVGAPLAERPDSCAARSRPQEA